MFAGKSKHKKDVGLDIRIFRPGTRENHKTNILCTDERSVLSSAINRLWPNFPEPGGQKGL